MLVPDVGGLSFLFAVVMASCAACWAVSDARDRGKPMLHILQLFVFLFWPIAVPIYLVATRGFRGVGVTVANAVGLMLMVCVGFYASLFAVYGLDVY